MIATAWAEGAFFRQLCTNAVVPKTAAAVWPEGKPWSCPLGRRLIGCMPSVNFGVLTKTSKSTNRPTRRKALPSATAQPKARTGNAI